jgi:hypothetical protein
MPENVMSSNGSLISLKGGLVVLPEERTVVRLGGRSVADEIGTSPSVAAAHYASDNGLKIVLATSKSGCKEHDYYVQGCLAQIETMELLAPNPFLQPTVYLHVRGLARIKIGKLISRESFDLVEFKVLTDLREASTAELFLEAQNAVVEAITRADFSSLTKGRAAQGIDALAALARSAPTSDHLIASAEELRLISNKRRYLTERKASRRLKLLIEDVSDIVTRFGPQASQA